MQLRNKVFDNIFSSKKVVEGVNSSIGKNIKLYLFYPFLITFSNEEQLSIKTENMVGIK